MTYVFVVEIIAETYCLVFYICILSNTSPISQKVTAQDTSFPFNISCKYENDTLAPMQSSSSKFHMKPLRGKAP